jgi:hypothetical protein
MSINYVINRKCYRASSYKEVSMILNEYKIQEVIKGPDWCPSIYFYMVKR